MQLHYGISTMNASQNKQSNRWIIIIAICSLLLITSELLISQYVSNEFSDSMQKQRKSSVSKMVRLAYNSIKPIVSDVHSGKIDSATARAEITDLVRNMTYEDEYGKNYIFMSSYDGIMLVQPFEPQKEGSNQWDLQDSNGRYIIRELVQAAKKNPNGSFVSYDYYLPAELSIEEKMSYVIGIPEIDAYIGTGMYMESSYRELQRVLELQRYGFLFMIVFILSAAAFYIFSLLKTNEDLSREIRERMYAESNIRTVFDSIHDAIIIHDDDGRVILANKRTSILYKIPEDQITQYSIQELSADTNDPKIKIDHTNRLENSSMLIEWKCRRPIDGTIFDGEVALRRTEWSGENVIVAVVRDISDRKKQENEIRNLAYNDYLTGLHNRVSFINRLNKELDGESVQERQGAILFIDLDNFKKINDSFGHFFGDEVLIRLADKLRSLAADHFLPARIGGDEFVILCQDADIQQVLKIAEKIIGIFREPIVIHENTIHITCSIGIALYPRHGITVEEIFKNADMAMYSAKDQGKDTYAFYEDVMSADMQYKMEMEKQLRLAYNNKEFVLFYQPLYDVTQKRIKGYEALIRWNSPLYGMVSPNRIIPLAEEIGLIDKIGDWVIDSAFAFAKCLQPHNLYISCNVSPVQLAQSNFVEKVIQKFEKYQLETGSVALEITESCLIESFDEASQKLAQLRDKGLQIYLDDFGTGYSSLNYLKNLPVDKIKIDKSFIDEITNSGKDSNILKTIIKLAHDMGLRTVAEGVESEAQYQYLKACHCDLIQGYLISKPKPEAEIRETILEAVIV
ncbi:MAG TPA: EAL domain-containing protein [Anaerovoracaceae bacterium]|nr:EAL domain-containing protein [Anaerovoracaceae bacterium]